MRMLVLCFAALCGCFGIACGAARADDEQGKKSPFAELANSYIVSAFPYAADFQFVPPVSAWGKIGGDGAERLRDFPRELVRKLKAPGTDDYTAAVSFVQLYSSFACGIASRNGRKDLDRVARQMFEPETAAIEAALIKALETPKSTDRLAAARSLMVLGSTNAKAKEIFLKSLESDDPNVRACSLSLLGGITANDAFLAALSRGVSDQNPDVRGAAAAAIIGLGPLAKSTTPALIQLLEKGAAAKGESRPNLLAVFDVNSKAFTNLALKALAAIGADASPAVPAIVRRFPNAAADEQCEMIACLAAIGPSARSAVPIIEKALASKSDDLKLTSAYALLKFDPDHVPALGVVKIAFEKNDGLLKALKFCEEIGPQSRSVAALVIPHLDHKDANVHSQTARTLCRMGPSAEAAIPKLEKILTQKETGERTSAAASEALARIGKKGIPVLLRAVESSPFDVDILRAVSSLGHDAPPEAIDCLIRILESKDKPPTGQLAEMIDNMREIAKGEPDKGKEWISKVETEMKAHRLKFTAIALSRLGEQARRARPALEKCRCDGELGVFVEAALILIDR